MGLWIRTWFDSGRNPDACWRLAVCLGLSWMDYCTSASGAERWRSLCWTSDYRTGFSILEYAFSEVLNMDFMGWEFVLFLMEHSNLNTFIKENIAP